MQLRQSWPVTALAHEKVIIANPGALEMRVAGPPAAGRGGTIWDDSAMGARSISEAPAAAGAVSPRVIYVMGAGRSGSTILGVALGNCDGVFFAGELNQWLMRSGAPQLDDPERQRFWSTVRDGMNVDGALLGGPSSRLERSSALLDARRWSSMRRLRERYRRASQDLYRVIRSAAGATYIVDTSHYPRRARELQSLRGIELYLLYLVRDPQAVIASLDRDDVDERRFGLWRANAYLWLTQLLAVSVFLRQPRERRLLIRHEDFLAAPEAVLGRILQLVGSAAAVPDLRALRPGVPFHGNRLIRQEKVALEGPSGTPARRSRVTTLFQAPWSAVISRLRPAAGGAAAAMKANFDLDGADARA